MGEVRRNGEVGPTSSLQEFCRKGPACGGRPVA